MDISVLGLPQSGKSTFLKSLLKFKESQELPEICTLKINDDRLIKVGELLGHNKLAYPEISFKEVNILSLIHI